MQATISSLAEYFPEVTVLFAGIVSFTALSSRKGPDELVGLLNELFPEFDALVEEQGLEKIKTVRDAYMAVAGTPIPRTDHAQAMA
jgi:class 3 adenylate cyclase